MAYEIIYISLFSLQVKINNVTKRISDDIINIKNGTICLMLKKNWNT